MNALQRSLVIFKETLALLKHDKELLAYPIFSSILIVLVNALILVPLIILPFTQTNSFVLESAGIIALIASYVLSALILTFFRVCISYTVRERIEGGNATLGSSTRFAFSRIRNIFLWSLVSATFDLIMRLLERLTRKLGFIGKIIASIVLGLLGLAWSLLTIFVVPIIVYENLSPFKAIKRSKELFTKTWGENLVQLFGMGLLAFLTYLVVTLIGVAGIIMLLQALNFTGAIIVVGLLIIVYIILSSLFSVLNGIYNTLLYYYATTGKVLQGYNKEYIAGAFSSQKKKHL